MEELDPSLPPRQALQSLSWGGSPQPSSSYLLLLPDAAPIPPSFPVFQAQAVTLTVAQAFKVAFEFWQVSKEGESSLLSFVSDVNRDG